MANCSITEKAINILRNSPRIQIHNLKNNPGAKTRGRQVRQWMNKLGKGQKELSLAAKPPLGWIFGDWYRPWQRRFPPEPYNKDFHLRREYPPLSLLELQRLIDLGWIDVNEPIDLTTLCNTSLYTCNPLERQFGVQLTDEGADCFAAQINIEVQWASELTIATIERLGGVVTTSYYDPVALTALVNPMKFFAKGEPIPRRSFPPDEILPRYADAKLRGYLANPEKVQEERMILGQKYGYAPPDLTKDTNFSMLTMRKDPLQLFFGLEPGWIVNLKDGVVLKPKGEKWTEYYYNS